MRHGATPAERGTVGREGAHTRGAISGTAGQLTLITSLTPDCGVWRGGESWPTAERSSARESFFLFFFSVSHRPRAHLVVTEDGPPAAAAAPSPSEATCAPAPGAPQRSAVASSATNAKYRRQVIRYPPR